MNIRLTTSGRAKNKIYFIQKNTKNFEWQYLGEFTSSLKLSKEENYKIWYFIDQNFGYHIVVKYKKEKDLEENMEDIVASLWDIIKTLDRVFHIDLDKLNLWDLQKQTFAELLSIKIYEFTKLKSKDPNTNYWLLLKCKAFDNQKFETIVESVDYCRDLVNLPTNLLSPDIYEKNIKERFEWVQNVDIKIFHKEKLRELGMWWIYEVWKWAESWPRLIILEYKPSSKEEFDYALVWKWVCFDTWGYNLKPTGAMEDMKLDMGWAATATWVFNYLVNSWIQKNILVALPLVENTIDWSAYKPGDIITMYNGSTVEIANTDAEWRLVMADAISYIQEQYSISHLFDIATLTGAQVVALGNKVAAMVGNNSKLNNKIQKLSWQIKDRCWELPYYTPYFKQYKSYAADMKNVNPNRLSPWTITAGLFLSQFVDNKNWVHFDIAGPVGLMSGSDPVWWEWASGFLVRTLCRYIEQ